MEDTEVLEATSDYVAETSFEDLHLSDPILRAIAERGYTHPTPVQARAIPLVMEGKDLIVRSKTGTGKTAAFCIPLLEKMPAGARRPLVLALCPTRELALQVAEEATALAKHKDLRVAAIYGGASMGDQLKALEAGAEIIVGTPGRVYDHIRRKSLDLSGAMACVLDEADEMLSMGFFEEVTRILDELPPDRQTLLFSATVPPDIDRLIRKYTRHPETLLLSGDVYTVEGIAHVAYKMVDDYPKPRNLLYLIELENPEAAIVFANTRDDTALVTAVLNRNGYDAELLNGDLPQKERERVMAKVKRGEVRFMVATDIAARGIDVTDLTHVINYSLPEDPSVYLHRVGRTGRIGKTGTAISLIGGRDFVTLTTLQKQFAIEFEQRNLPTPEEARKMWVERHIGELKEGMGTSVFEAFIPLAQELKTRRDGEFLIAYGLKYFFQHHRMDRIAAERAREREEAHVEMPAKREPRKTGGRREREREPEKRREKREPRSDAAPPRATNGHVEKRHAEEGPASEREMPERGTRLWVSLGRDDGMDEAGVKAALSEASGADTATIREVELRGAHSFVHVEPTSADAWLAANGKTRGDKELKVERPRRRRR